jgi:cell division protein FtsW
MKALTLPTFPQLMYGVTPRHLLMLSAGTLLCIGLVMVSSASMSVADAQFGNPFYFFLRHLLYMLAGLMVSIFAIRVPIATLQKYSTSVLLIAFALLVIVLIPGVGRRINGSMRWIGLAGFTLQPSEFAKFAVVTYISAYLVRRQDEVRSDWSGFFKPMLVVGFVLLLLLCEPDFGASVVVVSSVVGMLFLAGTPLRKFAVLLGSVAVAGFAAVIFEPYRMKRMLSFTDPWADQFNSGYQLSQSLIAFGRGDWLGVGLGKSVQKLFYLPEAHTDFVFAVYAEEFGFIGVLFVIGLFAVMVHSALRIGQQAEMQNKIYAAYLAYGLGLLFGVQAVINIGVTMGLVPTKGLTLPLVSYGGSSLVIAFAMLAVLLRIDSENTASTKNTASTRPARKEGGRA